MARQYRVNRGIRVPQIRVIDAEGVQLGVMRLEDALALAREQETDLVEVAPGAEPPVCRLMDFGKFKYEQNKKEREARKAHKSGGFKEVRLRPGISPHDMESKFRTVQKLLGQGAKVKVAVVFRGRSIAHPELGVLLLRKVAEGLQSEGKLERAPEMEGRMLSIILTPSKRGEVKQPAPAREAQPVAVASVEGSNDAKAKDP